MLRKCQKSGQMNPQIQGKLGRADAEYWIKRFSRFEERAMLGAAGGDLDIHSASDFVNRVLWAESHPQCQYLLRNRRGPEFTAYWRSFFCKAVELAQSLSEKRVANARRTMIRDEEATSRFVRRFRGPVKGLGLGEVRPVAEVAVGRWA